MKICCISSVEEARLAIACGADALGLVSHMPSGPGVISEEAIAEISGIVPPGVATFLLTSKQDASSIIDQQRRCATNTIQICDQVEVECLQSLRQALPGIKLVQVIHVSSEESIEEVHRAAPLVDAILLDSGNQKLSVKELGGTGRTHNWTISRAIRDAIDIPVILAGGLNFGNVAVAVTAVRPFFVDVCSGVRKDGKLNAALLNDFFEAMIDA
ncbi:MAG: phosphoribosylanthranilate isomerase [Candidatus Obscuribacterales bacterium]|nr:phosphoribosylanthranilate isomerase [Candidatus Obscuribacterales bacterium]